MSQDLLTQLAEYGAYCEERQGTVDATDVIGHVVPVPTPVSSSRPVRGWLVAAAAAALVLLVVGGVTLLSLFGGSAPVVEQPTATTVPTEIVNTTVPAEVEAAVVTETTLASIPVPPPGEGPRLEFVQAELPEDVRLQGGYWFKGALYAYSGLLWDPETIELYRSVDGFNWEVVPEFDPIDNPGSYMPDDWGWRTKTDGERLVNVAGTNSGGNCLAAGDAIQVSTSTDGVEWTSSEIPFPLPVTSSNTGCFNSGEGFAVGPRGIVVTTSVGLELGGGFLSGLVDPDEGTHVEVVEMDFERGVVTVRFIEEETGDVVDTVEIEVDGLGKSIDEVLDAMEADPLWEPAIGPLLQDMAENGGGEGFVSNGFAWFSVDGVSWEPIADVGPLQGPNTIASIVATADGFVATSEFNGRPGSSGSVQEVLWHSVDGTTWTEGAGLAESHLGGNSTELRWGLRVWDGQPVAATGDGVWTIEDSPRKLIPAEAVGRMQWGGFWFGELGFVGLLQGPEGASAEEILFSSDGSTWNRWKPPEFDPGEFEELFVVGMGDDFFVVQQRHYHTADETPSYTMWVGTLP
jgi:hypothetical protein